MNIGIKKAFWKIRRRTCENTPFLHTGLYRWSGILTQSAGSRWGKPGRGPVADRPSPPVRNFTSPWNRLSFFIIFGWNEEWQNVLSNLFSTHIIYEQGRVVKCFCTNSLWKNKQIDYNLTKNYQSATQKEDWSYQNFTSPFKWRSSQCGKGVLE